MSQENVDFVLALQPGPGVDIAPRFRDEEEIARFITAAPGVLCPDVLCIHRMLGAERTYSGIDGFVASWQDWLLPWEAYRSDVEQAIDCGERVLMLVNDFGRRHGMTVEVKSRNAAIWTIREQKVARAEFYVDRTAALEAVGLAE
jgi:hypothetical protein